MRSYRQISQGYLKEFQSIVSATYASGKTSVELATRPTVHRYLENLVSILNSQGKQPHIFHDIAISRTDRPDWRIEDSESFGIYCLGDHKNLSQSRPLNLNKNEKNQIGRYLNYDRPVFVFDGIEFLFFYSDIDSPKRISIIDKPLNLENNWENFKPNPDVENEFRKLLKSSGLRPWNEEDLISLLAYRANYLVDVSLPYFDAMSGSGETLAEERLIATFREIKEILESHHDKTLQNSKACAEFVAQVISFGLFYAHTRFVFDSNSLKKRTQQISEFWQLKKFDSQTKKLRPFIFLMETLSERLLEKNVIGDWYLEISQILSHAQYVGLRKSPSDFHTLFETFLSKFSKQTRYDRGAFYTPSQLSSWIIKSSNFLSKQFLDREIFDGNVQVIDPCCGTGSFIEALKNIIPDRLDIGTRIYGFEILPAPYALAHYRLQKSFPASYLEKLNILLTDTLSDDLNRGSIELLNDFDREKSDAQKGLLNKFRFIFGNPPSSDPIDKSTRRIIDELMNDFKPAKTYRASRQNIQKALQNEAYRFLRWACKLAEESEVSILSFVLPGAFSDSISLKNARKFLLDLFDKIFVLEIDEDVRRGIRTRSLFEVQQGRLVIIAVRNKEISSDKCEIKYASIANLEKPEKIKFLSKPFNIHDFEPISSNSNFEFSPKQQFPTKLWSEFVPILSKEGTFGIFKNKCSAVKLAPSAALFHTQREILYRRSSEISGASDLQSVLNKWFRGQQKPPKPEKFTSDVLDALGDVSASKDIVKYNFRPFVDGFVINKPSLFDALINAPGSGTRARPELLTSFKNGAIGIAIAPAPSDIGNDISRFASFAWNLPDNDLVARGNAMIYADQHPNKSGGLGTNISEEFLNLFSNYKNASHMAIGYIYGVLSSSIYRERFKGVLLKGADPENPIRIPIFCDNYLTHSVAEDGLKLARCEDFSFEIKDRKTILLTFSDDFREMDLKKFQIKQNQTAIILEGTNNQVRLSNIPYEVLTTKISGYNILEKWLRERKFSYLKRTIRMQDLKELQNLIIRLKKQVDIIKSIDKKIYRGFNLGCFKSLQ